jgi:peptide methionine sulfoxide reductase MsrA
MTDRVAGPEDSEPHVRNTDDPTKAFYFAEDYHQQYLAKNPNGYCPNHSTGVKLPDDWKVTPLQYID